MSQLFFFYLPCLHRSLVPEELPGDVLFFPAGPEPMPHPPAAGREREGEEPEGPQDPLKAGAEPTPAQQSLLRELSSRLPLPPQEAGAVLGEMLALGFTFGPEKLLAQGPRIPAGKFRNEAETLRLFAQSGEFRPEPEKRQTKEVSLVDCQKILLLAYELEARYLEMFELELELEAAEKALADWLGNDPPAEEDIPGLTETPDSLDGPESLFYWNEDEIGAAEEEQPMDTPTEEAGTRILPDWRLVTPAILAFLPEEAAVLTADRDMADHLWEKGVLGPAPEELKEALAHWPKDFTARLRWGRAPGWLLAGRGKPQKERPWLDRERRVLALFPKTHPLFATSEDDGIYEKDAD